MKMLLFFTPAQKGFSLLLIISCGKNGLLQQSTVRHTNYVVPEPLMLPLLSWEDTYCFNLSLDLETLRRQHWWHLPNATTYLLSALQDLRMHGRWGSLFVYHEIGLRSWRWNSFPWTSKAKVVRWSRRWILASMFAFADTEVIAVQLYCEEAEMCSRVRSRGLLHYSCSEQSPSSPVPQCFRLAIT